MKALHGTIKNVHVPAGLPEGTRVEILPINESRPTLGMREEDWPTTTYPQSVWDGVALAKT